MCHSQVRSTISPPVRTTRWGARTVRSSCPMISPSAGLTLISLLLTRWGKEDKWEGYMARNKVYSLYEQNICCRERCAANSLSIEFILSYSKDIDSWINTYNHILLITIQLRALADLFLCFPVWLSFFWQVLLLSIQW